MCIIERRVIEMWISDNKRKEIARLISVELEMLLFLKKLGLKELKKEREKEKKE
jgi:hypothetical protein